MLIVEDIWDEAQEIFGHCSEPKLLRRITDAVELLANKGEIDPLVGNVDLCVDGQCVTLPREIETVLAVNIGGRPSLGRDELFSFHLNGPGDFTTTCEYTWTNAGGFPTYRDLRCPSKLVTFLDSAEDNGKALRIYGFDQENRPLRTKENGVWVDGYLIPTVYGYAVPDSSAPTVSRITWIKKDRTVANVRLSTYDNSSDSGTLLGVFEPDETLPSYRRIKLSRSAEWVRIFYRRRSLELLSRKDRILLHSRPALILAMQAVKKYKEFDLGTAVGLEAQATRLLTEKESVLTPPTANPIQVNDRGGLKLSGADDLD
jgi:hypothetical protein